MNNTELYKRIDSFLQKSKMEEFLFYSGRKKEFALSQIYKEYEDIFSVNTLKDLIEKDMDEKDFSRREIIFLRNFLFEHFLEKEMAGYIEDVETTIANKKIRISSGEEMLFSSASIRQINNHNRGLRLEIEEAKREVLTDVNEMYKKIYFKTFETIERIGGKDMLSIFQKITHTDVFYYRELLKDFLKKTEGIYSRILKNILNRYLNLDAEEVFYFDMGYLGRNSDFDPFFPRERMVEIVQSTVQDMGLDYTAHGNVRFDLDQREGKSMCGFCSAIKIPDEIFLVCVPIGGVKDYGQFLHELGHALHFGYTNPEMPVSFKRLGDKGVTEGYASLFDHLIYNPYWLREKLGLEGELLKNYLEIMWGHKMYLMRLFIAEFFYHIELWRKREILGKEKFYSECFSGITRVNFPEYLYLEEIFPPFDVLKYIRAEILEAALYKFLTENFGKRWFASKSAGEFLFSIWRDGQKYYLEEIIQKLGIDEDRASLLSKRMKEVYKYIYGEKE